MAGPIQPSKPLAIADLLNPVSDDSSESSTQSEDNISHHATDSNTDYGGYGGLVNPDSGVDDTGTND